MSGLSDEEVESIRERVARNEDARGEFLKAQPIERDIVALLAHVDHLTAENARLERVVEDYENTIPLALRGGLAEHTDDECVVCNHAVYGQLLNPPTKGENDDRR